MKYQYVDVHCHPNLGELKKDQNEVVARMKDEGVLGIVVGVDEKSSEEAVALAEKHEHLYATVGLHPNYTQEEVVNEKSFAALLKHPKVVAVGECGLDFFRPEGDLEEAKKKQWEEFETQVSFAIEYDKPLMIHCRPSKNSMDAYEDLLKYLEPKVYKLGSKLRGNIHFFVGNYEIADRFWDIGFTTSFTGVLTFTNDYDEVVKKTPLNMILTETDAPYAAPEPHRGKRNEPVYVEHVVSAIARIRETSEDEIKEAVFSNARHQFRLDI